jgi:NADH-quinone oxidoreductase subunit H
MTTCLKYLVPISCFLFLGAAIWPLALAYLAGGETTWLPRRPLGDSVPRRIAGESVEVSAAAHLKTPEKGENAHQFSLAARRDEPSWAPARGARP